MASVRKELPNLQNLCDDITLGDKPDSRGKICVTVKGTRAQVEKTVEEVWKVVEVCIDCKIASSFGFGSHIAVFQRRSGEELEAYI